jgi:hypothetical protein
MSTALQRIRRRVMGVSRSEATAFSLGNSPTWWHLEDAVLAAVGGYHSVLDDHRLPALLAQLDQVPLELRGYAYEGAAMGLTGLDCFLPGRSRLREYMAGPGAPHIYMVHIGAGEALARLRRRPEPFLRRLPDPALRWLVMDGYGFHQGFFTPTKYVKHRVVPGHLSPYGARVFDQGIGRSLWFTRGARVSSIDSAVSSFPAIRRPDLWLGLGVGSCYVGGADRAALEELRAAAGPHADLLAVGAAFVAKGRQRAGNPAPHTDLAAEVLCGRSSTEAAHLVDEAFIDLPDSPDEPAYAVLQRRLRAKLTATPRAASNGA